MRGRSSSGRARPCQGRGSEFEPRRPLQNKTPPIRVVFCFGDNGRRGSNRPVPVSAGMATVRWTVAKAVCVSAAAAAERAEEPAVTHGLSFSFTIHLASVVDAAAFGRFVKRPCGILSRLAFSPQGRMTLSFPSPGKRSVVSPPSTNRGLPFLRLARMIVTDHAGRSGISQWSRK